MKYSREELINYDYEAHINYPRMSMNQRAAIFAPFAALSGYKEKIQKVIEKHSKE